MKEYRREYPLFSLCGLNCGLCPRYQTNAASKCPGCGGTDFHLKHPTCAVVTCNQKHDLVEYCFQCSVYPCEKYANPSQKDSFITYLNVIKDFEKACSEGLDQYKHELNEKVDILESLLANFNDGRRKNYYCLAVNLLPLKDLSDVMEEVNHLSADLEMKDKIDQVVLLLKAKADSRNIILQLRK